MSKNILANTSDAKSFMPIIFRILGIAVVLFILIFPVYAFNETFVYGTDWFFGTDTYMRMVRVDEWIGALSHNPGWETWYGNISSTSNWPYGQTLHWTRPLDIIIAVMALALAPFSGIERGLYYSGVGVSPLLAVLSILMLWRATRSFLDTRGQIAMAILLMAAPVTKNYFYAARPDHHSLLVFLFVIVFSLIIMMFSDDENESSQNFKFPLIAGIVSAIAVWASIEALVTMAFAGAVIGFIWFYRGKINDLNKLRWFLWGLLGGGIIALVIERPPIEWIGAVEYDRISIPHITLFLALAMVAECVWRAQINSTHLVRFFSGTVMVVVPAIVLFFIFPDFFKGPFAGAMDIALQDVWLNKIEELRPMFDGDLASASIAIMHLGPLLWVGWWFKKTALEQSGIITARPTTNVMLVLVLGIIIFVPLAIYQVRWSAYLGVIVALPLAALAQRLFDFNVGPKIGAAPGVPIFRVPVVVAVFIGPALGALVVTQLWDEQNSTKKTFAGCKWSEVTPVLKEIAAKSGRKINIMTRIHQGPEVLYRSGQNVVGTPHHRNTEGILDSFAVFADTDMEKVVSIISKRNIDYLALCKGTIEERVYLNTPGKTLSRMLDDGIPPKWLRVVPLPGDSGERFHVFKVMGP